MSDSSGGDRTRDADPHDGRDETLDERMDRNWDELMQEVRATQTGTQILAGFLLTIAFQQRFSTLGQFEVTLYLVLVSLAALTTVFALAPVNLHRALFRQHAKPVMVRLAHISLRVALLGVALIVIGAVLLIFDVVAGRTAGLIAASVLALIVAGVGLSPFVVARRMQPTRPAMAGR